MFVFGARVEESVVREIVNNNIIIYTGWEVDITKEYNGWWLDFSQRNNFGALLPEGHCILSDSMVWSNNVWIHKQLHRVWIHTLYKKFGDLYLTCLKKDLCRGKDESNQFCKDVDEMIQGIKDDCRQK